MFNKNIEKYIYIGFLSIIFLYLFYNFSFFVIKEDLVINDFINTDIIVLDQDEYTLSGHANNVKHLYINNYEIFLNKESQFTKKLYLFPKENSFLIKYVLKNDHSFERLIRVYRE